MHVIRSDVQTFLFSMKMRIWKNENAIHDKEKDENSEISQISDRIVQVASGTSFGELLVWKFHLNSSPDAPVSTSLRTKAHSGAILKSLFTSISFVIIRRLQWLENEDSIVSGSEDRTLALWEIPSLSLTQSMRSFCVVISDFCRRYI